MTAASAWFLLVVVWQPNVDPSVAVYPVKSQAQCLSMAKDFARGEEWINTQSLQKSDDDLYYTKCELAHGGDVEQL